MDRATHDQAPSDSAPAAMAWSRRAHAAWCALVAAGVHGRGPGIKVCEARSRRRLAAWPLSQVLWCASVVESTDGVATDTNPDTESLWQSLAWYRRGEGYLDHRPRGRRYFDDNAWLGLVAAQRALATGELRWWSRAAEIGRFVATGCEPSGAVRWVEGGTTLNACSTGAAGVLFAALAVHSPALALGERRRFRSHAQAAHDFLGGPLLRSDGLIADHQRADGSIEPSVWAYNQGLALRLADLLGDQDSARRFTEAGVRGLPVDALVAQPAVFACIWWRAVLATSAADNSLTSARPRQYLERAWATGCDADGLFSRVKRYDDGVLIDHASITGLMAAYAAGESVRRTLL